MHTVMYKVAFKVLMVLGACASFARASTWTVGGTSPDFADLPPAIAAAQPGDLILVRPGTYSGFVLDKGLCIVSSATPFSIAGAVTLQNIAAPQRAVLRGMAIKRDYALTLQDCSGEIILEGVDLTDNSVDPGTRVHVSDCANVEFTDLDVDGGVGLLKPVPTVLLERSSVRLAEAIIIGGFGEQGGMYDPATDGGDALDVVDSEVVLNRPAVIGGRGGQSDPLWCNDPNGGDGGHGLVITGAASEVVILGKVDHVVAGGNGGDGNLSCGVGGHGGDGVRGIGVISFARLAGGKGGTAWSNGKDGSESDGKIFRDDSYPSLRLDGPIDPGDVATFFLNTFASGNVLLVLAEVGGFAGNGRFEGPDFSAFPGGLYFALVPGRTDAAGYLVYNFSLPDVPEAQGLVIEAQAAVFLDSGRTFLSNATARALGE